MLLNKNEDYTCAGAQAHTHTHTHTHTHQAVSKYLCVYVTFEPQQITAKCKLCCQRIYLLYMLTYY